MTGHFYKSFAAAVALAACGAVQGAYLNNGDFESVTGAPEPGQTFTGWTENNSSEAIVAAQAISGSYSAKIGKVGANFRQATSNYDGLATFTLDLDFAASDPTTDTSGRTFALNLKHNADVGIHNALNMRVIDNTGSSAGELQVFSGYTSPTVNGSWQTILTDAVTFSTSETSLNVNHLRVVADYAATTPSYVISVQDAGGTWRETGSLSYFQRHLSTDTPPNATTPLRWLVFDTSNLKTGSWEVVDNITLVPEPTAIVFLGLGALALIRRPKA